MDSPALWRYSLNSRGAPRADLEARGAPGDFDLALRATDSDLYSPFRYSGDVGGRWST